MQFGQTREYQSTTEPGATGSPESIRKLLGLRELAFIYVDPVATAPGSVIESCCSSPILFRQLIYVDPVATAPGSVIECCCSSPILLRQLIHKQL